MPLPSMTWRPSEGPESCEMVMAWAPVSVWVMWVQPRPLASATARARSWSAGRATTDWSTPLPDRRTNTAATTANTTASAAATAAFGTRTPGRRTAETAHTSPADSPAAGTPVAAELDGVRRWLEPAGRTVPGGLSGVDPARRKPAGVWGAGGATGDPTPGTFGAAAGGGAAAAVVAGRTGAAGRSGAGAGGPPPSTAWSSASSGSKASAVATAGPQLGHRPSEALKGAAHEGHPFVTSKCSAEIRRP